MSKQDWPTKGLNEALKKIGAKSLVHAVEKVRGKGPLEEPKQDPRVAEYFKKAMTRIEELTKDVDTDRIPVKTREHLSQMPLDSIEQITAWGKAWAEEVKKIKV